MQQNNPECSLIGIWCAKEAVLKSMSTLIQITLQDIEIICKINSAPTVIINKIMDFDFAVSLSISHTKEYATAICVLK